VFYSAIFLLLGFGWFLLARCFGAEHLPGWRGMPAWYYRDGLLLGLGGAGALVILARAVGQLDRLWATPRAAVEAASFEILNPLLPAGSLMASAVTAGLFVVGLVALIAGSVALLRQSAAPGTAQALQFGLLLLLAVALVGSWGSPVDFAKQVLLQAILLAAYAFGVARLFRFNMLGYFLLAAFGSLALGAAELLQHPQSFVRWNGYATAAAALLLLVWPLSGWLKGEQRRPSVDGTV
jgi:hypothetical protein